MGGQSLGRSGQLRNEGNIGELNSPIIEKVYNLKIESARLIAMPLQKGLN
jgi:hypothetical protein